MNMPVKLQYFKNPKNRELTQADLDELARELDAIRQEVVDDIGEKDAKYIRRVYSAVRYSSLAGRALLFAGWFPPAWVLGTGLLSFSKIMENMELGHNVMHGQYDWMNDPKFNGPSYEWDIVGTADNWRQTHNYKHHTYTNIKGMDDDIGYGLVRLFPEQRWKPGFLLQPLYSIPFCLLFQWGVAIQNLEIGKVWFGRKSKAELKKEWFHSQCKVGITAGASTPDWIIEEVFFIMEDMNEMLEQEEMNLDVHKGSVVEGKVVDLTDDKAWISFGYKTEAVLPLHEYSYPEPASLKDVLQVGDSLRVQVVSSVKEDSTIFVSKIKVDRLADWDVAKEAFDKGEPVECEGIEAIKVGLLVQLKSLRGFIPLSQGDLRFVHSLQSLVGQKFKAKILEVDPTKNRLVLSRKAVLEEQRTGELDVIEQAYENGEVLKGTVKKIMPYGAFVALNGIEGLLHISDVSWRKISKVEDVLQPEQVIDVKIKSFDREKQRISFSHKDCLPNPWETAVKDHEVDDIVGARVVKILEFGVIVELEDGLTGLLHINEMTQDHNKKPGDICRVGDDLTVRIIGIDEARKRISFSLVEAPVHEEAEVEAETEEKVEE